MAKKAIIFGATGQDGSYLSELLLEKKYKVYAVKRRSSANNLGRISHLLDNKNFNLIEGDVIDPAFVYSIINDIQAAEIYNLAAQSHVGESFNQPSYTIDVDLKGVLYILDAIVNYSKSSRFYQASTSEMYGSCFSYTDKNSNRLESKTAIGREDFIKLGAFQDENTHFIPNSPYAVAKYGAHCLINIYRKSHKIFACSGILFNHESPRRGELFVTRKITNWIGKYLNGQTKSKLVLGNINSLRDWGHAKDYVKAMYLMLQSNSPDDYVVSTGKTYSVADFLQEAFSVAGIKKWKDHVELSSSFVRPFEVDALRGLPHKAEENLKWKPTYSFKDLVQEMVVSDINGNKVSCDS